MLFPGGFSPLHPFFPPLEDPDCALVESHFFQGRLIPRRDNDFFFDQLEYKRGAHPRLIRKLLYSKQGFVPFSKVLSHQDMSRGRRVEGRDLGMQLHRKLRGEGKRMP